jgi:hypothetical protein
LKGIELFYRNLNNSDYNNITTVDGHVHLQLNCVYVVLDLVYLFTYYAVRNTLGKKFVFKKFNSKNKNKTLWFDF